MPANINSIAYVGATPWHKQGVALGDREVSSREMLKAAGLDWKVELVPVTTRWKGKGIEVPGRKAVVRQDTGAVLADVSDDYAVYQNAQLFKFLDGLAGRQKSLYHTAGALGEGEKVWALLKLPQTAEIVKGDALGNYLLGANAFDGSFKLRIKRTRIRVVCQNTLNQALGDRADEYSQVHAGDMEGRMSIEEARRILGMAEKDFAEFVEVGKALAHKNMTETQLKAFVEKLFPYPALPAPKPMLALPAPTATPVPDFRFIDKKRDKVRELVEAGMGNALKGVRGTRWAALNGAVEYADYLQGSDRKRTENLLWGEGAKLKQQAFDLLTADLKRS